MYRQIEMLWDEMEKLPHVSLTERWLGRFDLVVNDSLAFDIEIEPDGDFGYDYIQRTVRNGHTISSHRYPSIDSLIDDMREEIEGED